MALLQALLQKKTRQPWPPAWTYAGNGLLWLLRFSGAGHIVGEVRHPVERTVRYFCLDERSGRPLWENRAFDEPWWLGIEDITPARIYLHRFRKPDMPRHAGIIALDIATGAVLWENPDSTFLFVHDGRVYATRQGFDSMTYSVLDPATGSIDADLGTDPERINALRAELNALDWFGGYAYPTAMDGTHPDQTEAEPRVLPHVHAETLRGPVDVLCARALIAASWHERAGDVSPGDTSLVQRFAAWHRVSGELLFEDDIARGMASPGPDSFFTKDEQLFYVRDGITLTAHALFGI